MIYLTQSIHRNAQIFPDKAAIVFKDRQHNWREIKDRISRLAAGLHSLGVKKGDRIAVLSMNSDRYVEMLFGIPWVGAISVPMNIRWSAAEHAYSLEDSGADVLFVDGTFLEMATELKAQGVGFRHIVYTGDGDTPVGMISYESLLANHKPAEDMSGADDDVVAIYYTGGTTGFPKGVMLSHKNIWSNTSTSCGILHVTENSEVMLPTPLFHIAASVMLQCAIMVGARTVILPEFTPDGTIQAMEQYKTTNVLLVPTMIQMLSNSPLFETADLSNLQYLIYGASPITESVLLQAMNGLPHTQFMQVYGQTESSPIATKLGPEYHTVDGPFAGKLRSAGRAVPCSEIRIVDADNNEAAVNQVGEITIRGPNVTQGYWNKPDETQAALRNGWLYTGDAGYLDSEGFVFLVDRVKDMIISGGENVYSIEVENAVMKHPGVAQVVVIGIPSEKWGEQVHAEVILKENATATADDISAEVRKHIAGYKCPSSVTFRTEPFPMSGAGKVLKRDVRKPYWESSGRMIG